MWRDREGRVMSPVGAAVAGILLFRLGFVGSAEGGAAAEAPREVVVSIIPMVLPQFQTP